MSLDRSISASERAAIAANAADLASVLFGDESGMPGILDPSSTKGTPTEGNPQRIHKR